MRVFRSKRVLAALSLAAALGPIGASTMTTPASAAPTPSAATRSPKYCHRPTVKRTVIVLIAGSSSYLAYGLGYKHLIPGLTSRQEQRCFLPVFDNKSEYLWVRSKSGKARDLGRMPIKASNYTASLVGSTLYMAGSTVRWWNLKAHTKGHVKLPPGERYFSGAPHGFVVARKGHLYEESTSGTLTSLGTPFGPSNDLAVVSNAKGLGVRRGGATRYLSFADPGHFRTLQVSDKLSCTTLSNTYLGCNSEEDIDSDPQTTTALIPLSGAAPVLTTKNASGYPVALAGRTLIWQTFNHVVSLNAATPTPLLGARALRFSLDYAETYGNDHYQSEHSEQRGVVSVFGGVALVNARRTHVVLAQDATHTKPLFKVPATDH